MRKTAFSCLAIILAAALNVHAQEKLWTLRECIDRAWQQNIQLRLTIVNNELNSVNLYQSRYTQYPSLNASGNQGFSWGRSVDPFTNQYVTQSIHSNNFSLSSNVVLFAGFQYRNTIRKYQLDVEAGLSANEAEKNTIALNVAGAYLQILLANEQLGVARSQVAASQSDVDRTQLMVDVGKVAEANLYQLKSQLATYKSQVVDAENQVALAKLTLEQLMELPADPGFSIAVPELSSELIPMDTTQLPQNIYNTALTTQPQIKGADQQVQSALMYLKVNEGALYPRLTLGGSLTSGYSSARNRVTYQSELVQRDIGFVKGNPGQIVTGDIVTEIPIQSPYAFGSQLSDNFAQSILFNLTVPIFNAMQVRSNVKRAKINIEQAQLNQQSTKNDLRKSVEQAFTDMKAADKKYYASKEALTYSDISYKNIQERYNQGLSTANDLFIQKNNFIQSKSQLLQAKYDYIFKQKVLDFYLGKAISL